jgi:hypothetical protein
MIVPGSVPWWNQREDGDDIVVRRLKNQKLKNQEVEERRCCGRKSPELEMANE